MVLAQFRFYGASHFEILTGSEALGQWTADELRPTYKPDGHSSTRHTIFGAAFRPGDEIRIIGIPDGGEQAPIDYIGITPQHS